MKDVYKRLKFHVDIEKVMLFFVVCYFALFLHLTFARHDGLKSYLNDLGNVDQSIYTTLKGKFMYNSNVPANYDLKSRLGGHANFILLAFVPVYYFYADPKVLLFTQTFLISIGALPLFWLGKKMFDKYKWLPLVAPMAYLMNPKIHDITLYDFHPIAVAMPLTLFAFYFMYTRRFGWFYFFAVLIALCKEDMPLIVFMLGIYMIFVQKERKKGMIVSFLSVFYFVFLIGVVMPFFAGEIGSELTAARYVHLGGSIFEIIFNLIRKPWVLISNLVGYKKGIYLFSLLFPVAFLPIFSLKVFLLSTPSLLINMLSLNKMMYYPTFYYHSAPIMPFLFLATLFSLEWMSVKMKPKGFIFIVLFVINATLLSSCSLSQVPFSKASSWEEFGVTDHAKRIEYIKEIIPENSSLSVQGNLGAHFSQRLKIYRYPEKIGSVDYVLIDVNDPYPVIRRSFSFRNFADIILDPNDYYESALSIFGDRNYNVEYFTSDGYFLFKRERSEYFDEEAFKVFNENAKKVFSRYEDREVNYVNDLI